MPLGSGTPFDTLAHERRWVAWRNEPRNDKPSKMPYAPSGRKAKTDDPATWGTRAEAEARAARLVNGHGGGGGIQLGDLGDDIYLAGLDLDSSLSQEGTLMPWAEAILSGVPTYAEVSPSGRGLKLFFYVENSDVRPFLDRIGILDGQWGCRRSIPGEDSRDHGPAVEVYLARRYFAVTSDQWPVAPVELAMLINDALLDRLALLIPPARSAADRRGEDGGDNSRSAIAFRKGAARARPSSRCARRCAPISKQPNGAVRRATRTTGGSCIAYGTAPSKKAG
jgi:putative DNA primase/helicase